MTSVKAGLFRKSNGRSEDASRQSIVFDDLENKLFVGVGTHKC